MQVKKRIYGKLSVFWVLRSVISFQFRKCVVNRNYMVRTSRGQGPLNCGKKASGCHVSQKRIPILPQKKSTPCLSDNIRETPSWEMKIDTLDPFKNENDFLNISRCLILIVCRLPWHPSPYWLCPIHVANTEPANKVCSICHVCTARYIQNIHLRMK